MDVQSHARQSSCCFFDSLCGYVAGSVAPACCEYGMLLLQVAGTEQGVTEPEATFSACFGGAFLMWHPMKYASMLAEKMEQHGTTAWLVNTGWTGGR